MSHNLRTFYALVISQTLSLIGTRISSLAIGIAVFQDTGNATPLTLVAFFAILPMVFASSLAGVLADRWDRRWVMILADTGQALCTFLLLVSFASGSFELWHLYLLTSIQSVFGVFQGPAFLSAVTMLVPDSHRDRANAINQLTGPMAGIIAPTLAATIYSIGGVEGAILADLTTFCIATLIIFMVRIPPPPKTEEGRAMEGSLWKESLGGLRYLWMRRPLLLMLIFTSAINFLFGLVMVLNTPYILSRTGHDEIALGVILSLTNIGAIVGGIIIGIWGGTRPRTYTIIPGIGFSGLMMVVVGMGQSVPAIAIPFFLLMLPMPMVNTLFMSMIQAKVAPDIQGRVFAVISQVSVLLTPLAYLVAGPLADNVFEASVGTTGWEIFAPVLGNSAGAGIGLMIVVCGTAVVFTSIMAFMTPNVRNLESLWPDYVIETEPLPESLLVDAV